MLLELSLTALASSAVTTLVTSLYFKRVINKYEICPVYNILTRVALEDRWESVKKCKEKLAIAFLDVDRLKEANQLYGQDICNEKLAKSFSVLRSSEKFHLSGRYFSGDEIAIIAPSHEICQPLRRVQQALKDNGLSATIAVTLYQQEKKLTDAVKRSNAIVERLKADNVRGIVHYDYQM
jgi:GGDEF domain-containing protein